MRILLLDIDGVLAPWDTGALDVGCVRLLDELVARSGAVLVLTSSWRDHTSLPEIERQLRSAGLRHPLREATPVFPSAHRVDELRAWLDAHRAVERFVALDDEPLAGLEDQHVRTDDALGLTRGDVDRALMLLDAQRR